MTGRGSQLLIALLLVLGVALRSPMLILLAALLALAAAASALWWRYGLAGVSYSRRFGAQRLFCGEETDLWVEIVNAKPLPLAWLKTEDEFPEDLAVQRVELAQTSQERRRLLRNLFSLRWYERVRRHYRMVAQRRGAFDVGPVTLSSGDLFGFQTRFAKIDHRHQVLVYPRVVPLHRLDLRAAMPSGEFRAERRIVEDPLRLAGVRPYAPGDPVGHIHWKNTARHGALQTKVFEPAASHHLLVFVNNQTRERGYEGVMDDHFETAMVAAASIASAALEARRPVGLLTNGGVLEAERRVRLPASRHGAQLVRILETLAQMTYYTIMPFEALLRIELPQLPYGAAVIAVSALVTEPILSALLDVRAAGHPTALVAIGQPALRPPPELPIYAVVETWKTLETIELG